jgi:methylation protein EvaC
MNNCPICQKIIKPIFSLGTQPLANKYPKNLHNIENEYKSEMNVFFCRNCSYANVPCNVQRSIFFEDYYYLSSVNKELNEHFNCLADDIYLKKYNFVLDIGSNDGILLRPLKNLGIKCLGVDPSENVSKIANEQGLITEVGFFDSKMVDIILNKYQKPDLITASSVFTHLEDPSDFFKNAKKILCKNGRLIIEVEYLEKIITDFAFERFYFDRPHYYSLKSLAKLGARFGFSVKDAKIINVHGGSIRVTFVLSEGEGEIENINVLDLLKKEAVILNENNILTKFKDFQNECIKLKESISKFKNDGLTVAAYGCPARFSTITNFAQISSSDISYVVDDSPLKQDRYSPGMHIPITSYNNNSPDIYIVFAYEYINSIKEKVGYLNSKFYKPIPFINI